MQRNFVDILPRRGLVRAAWFAAVLLAALALFAGPLRAQNAPLAPQNLVGVWRGQEASAIGTMSVEVIFFANGTYSRAHTAGALMTRDVGTYSVVQNWIHFRLRDYEPKYYMGRVMTRPMADTWVVNRFDGSFLEATVGGASVVRVQRVR